ncbi:MAG: alpha-galactosidase [Eubacteriales bacterium]|nr:alpha-galactosidase [Eubacteriales bacterium]
MSIFYNENDRVFTLKTANTMYQMQVSELGHLLHLYYGADLGDTVTDYRLVSVEHSFSGNPYESGFDRNYSLDTLPQEYAGYGNGDYRVCALKVENPDGSEIVHLVYDSFEISDGKYALAGLPAMHGDGAKTLKIVLKDTAGHLEVELLYGVFEERDVITRAARIRNAGTDTVTLREAMSLQIDYPKQDMDLIHFYGRHAMERMTERTPLAHGIHSLESVRGTSSHHHNPFVILCDHDATEQHGDCYGYALVYSGNFKAQTERDQIDQTRLVMGIHPAHFAWKLGENETFETPETVMAYSEQGLSHLTHLLHDAFRSNLIRSKYVESPRPILINNWEATYFDFNEEKLYGIAKNAKEIGLDLFVLDDGWFGKRDNDLSGLGDWYVNEQKLKGGLAPLAEKIRGLGMKFGIWIEPEMVSEDSDLFREHPDWCLLQPQHSAVRSRHQLNLDVSRKEVRDHVMNQIFRVLDDCRIDYVKWDMNRSIANVFSAGLPAERQGEIYHRYMLGLYEMMERLVSRYPDLLFENCSGGGGRFDAGMLYYSPQIWCSDNTDAIDRLKIQYGTSFAYPISTMGAHVSVCPNHQTGRTVPLKTRGVVASAGTFGFELDLEKMTEEEKAEAKAMVQEYKSMEHLVQTGDYYRLSDPFKNEDYAAWQFVAKDQSESVVSGVILRGESSPHIHYLRLQGLDGSAHYRETESGRVYTGAALKKAGIPLPTGLGDYRPVSMRFVRVN